MLPADTDVARPAAVAFGPFTFDRRGRLLHRGEQELPLPPRVLGILELLVARAGEIVPRQELIDSVWKEAFVTDTSLAEAISFLRQALGDDPQTPTYIQTVHRRGYRFVAPVREVARATPSTEAAPAGQRATASPKVSPSIGGQLVPWSAAVLCLFVAAAAIWQYTHLRSPLPPVVRIPIEPQPGTAFDRRAPALTLSPDGRVVAWSACDTSCRLYMRGLDRLDSEQIPGTDGASAPFFSPDGRWIGFFAAGKLRKVALAGGEPVALTDAPQPFGAVWTRTGHIVFAASARGGLFRVNDAGGEAEQLTLPSAGAGEVRHAWPSLAPDGASVLFTVAASPLDGAAGRIAVTRVDAAARASSWRTFIDGADVARAASPDYIAFSRGAEIHAVAFDKVRALTAGAEQSILRGVARGQFAISNTGAIVYATGAAAAPVLMWTGAAPSSTLTRELAALQSPALSFDGAHIAGIGGDRTSTDIWVGDLERGALTRLTHGGVNVSPVWGEDAAGPVVFFAKSKGGAFRMWARDAAAAGAEMEIAAANRHPDRHVFPSSFARHAGLLAYGESGGTTRGDIIVMSITDGAQIASVTSPFDETNGMVSPDGRLLAYQSDESGRWEIYLLRIADKRPVAVSTAGGISPRWSADGRALFFLDGGALMKVDVDPDGDRLGTPERVAPLPGAWLAGIAPDGRVLVRFDGERAPDRAILTLEWLQEVRRMLGPPVSVLPR